jgi:hypothetical protein
VSLSSQTFYDLLVTLLTLLVVAYGLFFLYRWLRRGRPEMAIGGAIAAALAIRVLAAAALSIWSVGDTLRGTDEVSYLLAAHDISQVPFGSADWTHALTHQLQLFIFSFQVWTLNSPEFALRIVQAGIAVGGLALLAASAYELAGRRAAVVSAWILALEPTSIFFSSVLHKEPNMMLAGGLVVYGGTMIWKRGDLRFLVPAAIGCLIAVLTRPYGGWFLIGAVAAVCIHAGMRAEHRGSLRSLSLVAMVVLLAAVLAPTIVATSDEGLHQLQVSSEANAANQEANLSLEQADFSTPGAALSSLPKRTFEVAFQPYPWQLNSPSQRIGILGTAVAYSTLGLLIFFLGRARGKRMALGAPIIYPLFFLFVAYSLSAGNAGTAFRYRTHLVALAIVLVIVLWAGSKREVESRSRPPAVNRADRSPVEPVTVS